jgi:Ca2+-binding RTX toxin-like protein
MLFNGSAGAEQFTLSANGPRLRFFRDVGNVTMDTAGVETVDVNALGGADIVTVNDLTGTDVSGVNVDLASSIGGTTSDATADRVIVNGTAQNDAIQALGDASLISVAGLQPHVSIQHQDTIDTLTLNGLDGADSIDASGLAANAIALQLNGGTGNDTIAGGQGVETSDGGPGNDVIDGNKGADTALLGTGDDTFVWDPGDGSDIVEGQAGSDTMRFNGAPGDEKFTLSANGTRFKLLRDVGNITMDTAGVETVDVNALGGADLVDVGDLTGTEVKKVNVDLASALGGTTGDSAFDQVVVTGTPGSDLLTLTGNASGVQVAGIPATVAISHQEPTDRLAINTLDGFDLVSTGGFVAGSMQLFIDGIQQ